MKKILLYIPIIMLAFWSCDQMEDVYNELDEKITPYSENIEYKLTDADYKTASQEALKLAENKSDSTYASKIDADKAFNPTFEPTNLVGPILAKNFPALNQGSVALISYNYNLLTFDHHTPYLNAEKYKLGDDDYAIAGGDVATNGIFFPSSTPEDNMDDILSAEFTDAVEGDYVYVTYKSSDTEPGEGDLIEVDVYNEDFDQYSNYDTINLDGWMHFEETGSRTWLARAYSGNSYAQFSAFGSGEANVAWQISPAIDLSNPKISGKKLSFDVNIGYYTHEGLSVLISTDFDGSDVLAATWDDATANFTIPTTPTGGYGSFTSAGNYSLSSYSGEIYVAFKYTGDGSAGETTTYQVDNVVVSGLTEPYKEYDQYYAYNGTSWNSSDDVMVIQADEYDEMGAPGAYNNFSASVPPENYIPNLLSTKYAYPQEDDLVTVSYKYYSSGSTKNMLDDYKYKSGMWQKISTIEETTGQYLYGTDGWVFDPTVMFTMNSADYNIIVEWVLDNLDASYGYSDRSREFYYGAASKYSNFDLRVGQRTSFGIPGFEDLTDEEAIDKIWSRIPEAIDLLLKLKYPEAKASVGGIDVHYYVTFYTYENDLSSNYYTIHFQCTKDGPNPEFTQDTDYATESSTVYGKYGIRKVE